MSEKEQKGLVKISAGDITCMAHTVDLLRDMMITTVDSKGDKVFENIKNVFFEFLKSKQLKELEYSDLDYILEAIDCDFLKDFVESNFFKMITPVDYNLFYILGFYKYSYNNDCIDSNEDGVYSADNFNDLFTWKFWNLLPDFCIASFTSFCVDFCNIVDFVNIHFVEIVEFYCYEKEIV